MHQNVGKTDRYIRVVLAVLLLGLVLSDTVNGTMATIALVVAGIMAFTAWVRFCPLYALIGANTCPTRHKT